MRTYTDVHVQVDYFPSPPHDPHFAQINRHPVRNVVVELKQNHTMGKEKNERKKTLRPRPNWDWGGEKHGAPIYQIGFNKRKGDSRVSRRWSEFSIYVGKLYIRIRVFNGDR